MIVIPKAETRALSSICMSVWENLVFDRRHIHAFFLLSALFPCHLSKLSSRLPIHFSNPQMGGNTIDELLNHHNENELANQQDPMYQQ